MAAAAVVQCWWLDGCAAKVLYAQAEQEITRNQERNAAARRSHVKATRRKLREIGIKLTQIKRCIWKT
jgi:hypothetical protein